MKIKVVTFIINIGRKKSLKIDKCKSKTRIRDKFELERAYLSCVLLCLCARLFICAMWSPAGKGLTSWLSFVVSNCEIVTFSLVSWVRCGTNCIVP